MASIGSVLRTFWQSHRRDPCEERQRAGAVMHLGTIGITQKAKYMRSRRRSRWCAHMHVLHGRTPNSHSVFGFIYVLVDCARFRLPTRVESNVRLNGRRSAALCVC